MSLRNRKLLPGLPDKILENCDPKTALAAKVLHTLGITLTLWCLLFYFVLLPFFVARRMVAALMVTTILAGSLIALFLLYRSATDGTGPGVSGRLREDRVRNAGWALVGPMWFLVMVFIVLDGGIVSRGLILAAAVIVMSGALLGPRVALSGTGMLLGTTLVLAILDHEGLVFPRYFPSPPIMTWFVFVLCSVLIAVPSMRVFAAALERASEIERLNRALREREEQLRTIVEAAPDAIFILSASMQVMEANDAALRQLGYSREELMGMHVTDFVAPEFRVRTQALFGDLAGSGFHESRHVRKEGSEVPVELNTRRITFQGEPALLEIARDITVRKYTEKRLRALSAQLLTARERERSRIAHDLHEGINQQLAGLAIGIGLLRRHQSPDAGGAYLAALQEQATRVAEDLRQISQQINSSVLENAGLGPALEALCRQTEHRTKTAVRYSPQDVPGGIDQQISVVLYRVAEEAVQNAVKHAEASLIEVSFGGIAGASGAAGLRLSVTDNGKGFVTEDPQGGLGLGLLTIEEWVRLVKGTVAIRSKPGEGTAVEVEVPLP